MKRIIVALTALLLVVGTGAYAVADAKDMVPGILTLPEPIPAGLAAAPQAIAPAQLPEPPALNPAALEAAIAPVVGSAALGRDVGVIVRDAASGEVLLSRAADQPRVLASLQKLLASVALADSLDLDATMTTKAVSGATPGDVVLVAGGDTLLARGAGNPGEVVGRAGLADLAAKVNATAPAGPLTLHLDATYAAGPRTVSTWAKSDVTLGYTRGVAQIGLADLRPIRGRVPAVESDADVMDAFAEALRASGRTVEVAGDALTTPAARDASVLGAVQSAPYIDVIAHALAESDNAIYENLTRQAMVHDGAEVPADGVTGDYVRDRLEQAGIDVTNVGIKDASGLTPGQTAPLAVIDAVLARAVGGNDLGLRRIIAELPVAGLSGTLAERFEAADTRPAAGIPRAKTGSLTGVSSLAGTTVDAQGRLLTFAIVTNSVPPNGPGTKGAREALDRFATVLTACGCR